MLDICDTIGLVLDALEMIFKIVVKVIQIYESDEPGEVIRAILGLLFFTALLAGIVYFGFVEVYWAPDSLPATGMV